MPTSTNSISFKYDCFGRRLEKATPTTAERYYYTGWQEIEEQSSTNGTVATFVWGNGIDELLTTDRGAVMRRALRRPCACRRS